MDSSNTPRPTEPAAQGKQRELDVHAERLEAAGLVGDEERHEERQESEGHEERRALEEENGVEVHERAQGEVDER